MTLLSSFDAVRYRGIDGLSVPRLTRANLVTGANGIGKTALVEAIWLFASRYEPQHLWSVNVQRTLKPSVDSMLRLFGEEVELFGIEGGLKHELKTKFIAIPDVSHPAGIMKAARHVPTQPSIIGRIGIHIDGNLENGDDESFQTPWGLVTHPKLTPPSERPNVVIESTSFPFQASSAYLERYSEMVRDGDKAEFTEAINLMFPTVKDVGILTGKTEEPYLSALTEDGRQLPLQDLGDGIVWLCRLFLGFFAARSGLLLVDELASGVHHTKLAQIWEYVHKWTKELNVQFMATTHSDECIRAAAEAFADTPQDLTIHNLFMNQVGKVEVATFTGQSLEGAMDLNLEIR